MYDHKSRKNVNKTLFWLLCKVLHHYDNHYANKQQMMQLNDKQETNNKIKKRLKKWKQKHFWGLIVLKQKHSTLFKYGSCE
jgi:chromosome condensin MukBEF ATPase and DNA-binding subunit MukB